MENDNTRMLNVQDTLNRMEPGAAPIQEVAFSSIAISLKRIADNMQAIQTALYNIDGRLFNHEQKLNQLNNVVTTMGINLQSYTTQVASTITVLAHTTDALAKAQLERDKT